MAVHAFTWLIGVQGQQHPGSWLSRELSPACSHPHHPPQAASPSPCTKQPTGHLPAPRSTLGEEQICLFFPFKGADTI